MGATFLCVLISTLLLPILMIPILRKVTSYENNRDNLVVMLILAAISVGVAIFLTGIFPISVFAIIGYLFLFILSAGWVGTVMNKLAENP
jgi:hypothetical protein